MQYITLSTKGTKLLAQAKAAGTDMDKDWLGGLTAAEQAMMVLDAGGCATQVGHTCGLHCQLSSLFHLVNNYLPQRRPLG